METEIGPDGDASDPETNQLKLQELIDKALGIHEVSVHVGLSGSDWI